VCIHMAKTPQYFLFFLFFYNFLHFKIINTHICIYITSITSNTCIYPQIHQTYQIDAYMHAYNIKYIKHIK
jgi:hypothetical protein